MRPSVAKYEATVTAAIVLAPFTEEHIDGGTHIRLVNHTDALYR